MRGYVFAGFVLFAAAVTLAALLGDVIEDAPEEARPSLVASLAVGNSERSESMAITVRSAAFKNDGTIPQEYTCDGSNVSPPLEWEGVPAQAKSVALIAEDPDAPRGTFTHWLVYNIPAKVTRLEEGIPLGESVANGLKQGENDFGRTGYGGPCPPQGTHRYFFHVFALDQELDLPGAATENMIRNAMKGHILAEGELMGKYRKQR